MKTCQNLVAQEMDASTIECGLSFFLFLKQNQKFKQKKNRFFQ